MRLAILIFLFFFVAIFATHSYAQSRFDSKLNLLSANLTGAINPICESSLVCSKSYAADFNKKSQKHSNYFHRKFTNCLEEWQINNNEAIYYLSNPNTTDKYKLMKAESHINIALMLNKNNASVIFNRGATDYLLGNKTSALFSFSAIASFTLDEKLTDYSNYYSGLIYSEIDSIDKAGYIFQELESNFKTNARFQFNWGRLLLMLDSLPEALSCLRKAVRSNKKDSLVLRAVAYSSAVNSKYHLASRFYSRLHGLDIKNETNWLRLIDSEIRAGLLNSAKNNCEELLEQNKKSSDALYLLSRAYTEKKKYDQAIHYANMAMDLNPYDYMIPYHIGNIYNCLDSLDIAIEYYEITTELNPEFPHVYECLGYAYYDQKEYDNAVYSFLKYVELQPRQMLNMRIVNALGYCFIEAGYYTDSKEIFELILSIEPTNSDALNGLGMYYENIADYATSLEFFSKAIKSNKWDKHILNNRAALYHRNRLYFKAAQDYRKARLLDKNSVKINNGYSLALEAICKFKKADKISQELMADTSGVGYLYNNRALILHRLARYNEYKGDTNIAKKNYNTALSLIDTARAYDIYNESFFYNNKGLFRKDMGMYEESIRDFHQLNNGVSRNNEAVVHALKNNTDSALTLFNKSIELDSSLQIPHVNIKLLQSGNNMGKYRKPFNRITNRSGVTKYEKDMYYSIYYYWLECSYKPLERGDFCYPIDDQEFDSKGIDPVFAVFETQPIKIAKQQRYRQQKLKNTKIKKTTDENGCVKWN